MRGIVQSLTATIPLSSIFSPNLRRYNIGWPGEKHLGPTNFLSSHSLQPNIYKKTVYSSLFSLIFFILLISPQPNGPLVSMDVHKYFNELIMFLFGLLTWFIRVKLLYSVLMYWTLYKVDM